ncbi:TetR/AcrR family transcriptional regulator [Rathayibacter sp. KR2-224]|uniref:TetR/AcrR family transcriptional regulator n=1 Tax=Rathayibacter sp. KR2-224 TaxID=3400913 RepID=UPI003BFF5315
MPDKTATTPRPPAPSKVKILATADRLFYDEGVHTVGVDRIIAQSHVTKATFYKHYRSKDVLIAAYVATRADRARNDVDSDRETLKDASAVLRSMIERFAVESRRNGYRGCPFINAATSQLDAAGPVTPAVVAWRSWLRSTLVELLTEAGSPAPEAAADDLLLARDGAFGGTPISDSQATESSLHRALDRLIP